MRRTIDVEEQARDGQEGLLYDVTLARTEGLYEELTLEFDHPEAYEPITVGSELPPEVFEWFVRTFDLGVNMEPGQTTAFRLNVTHTYDYGKVDEDSTIQEPSTS